MCLKYLKSAQNEVFIPLWSDFTLIENKMPLTFKSSQSIIDNDALSLRITFIPRNYNKSFFFKIILSDSHLKWNEWGFRPPLCTYRLNRARRTSRERWWDEWDDTALQTQDAKFEPWRSEVDHASSRLRRPPTILKNNIWALLKVIDLKQLGDQFREVKLILLIRLYILILTIGSDHETFYL